jgi:type I restriction enzyme, S subunit
MSENAPLASDWREDSIRSIVDPSRPITYGVVQPGTRLDQGVPIIRGQDYSSGSVDDSDLYLIHPTIADSYKRSKVMGGDILFSIVGYLGQTAIVPEHLSGANITQTTARIAVKAPHRSRFFLQQFRSEKFSAEVRKHQKGSAQPGLNLADVEKMKVVIPLPKDQSRIAAVLDTVDEAVAKT